MPQSKKSKSTRTKSRPNKQEILKKPDHKIKRKDVEPADRDLSIEELDKAVGGIVEAGCAGSRGCRSCRGCRC
jgi:hypothetical protein